MQILLVEDDLSLADSLTTALKREGFTINHLATGKAALLAAETVPPELVILDLGLPDMDGLRNWRAIPLKCTSIIYARS